MAFDDPLQIGDDLYLLLEPLPRIFNHSCNPNAGLRFNNQLFAARDIRVDEEITYDYSTTVGKNTVWRMVCRCGAAHCRRELGNVLSIPKVMIQRYFQLDLLQDYMKRQLGLVEAAPLSFPRMRESTAS